MTPQQKLFIALAWQKLFRDRGWDRFETMAALGEREAGNSATSSKAVRRIQVEDDGVVYTLYVKRYEYPIWRRRWSGFYRGTFLGASKARTEFRNLIRLRQWGLDAPVPVAYGEERRARWLYRSFLISESVEDPLPLDLFIRDHLPGLASDERRRLRAELVERLADTTRRMHDHGFVHHDYFWRNILLNGTSLGHFHLIDSHKGRCWKPFMERRARAKDLATLDAPAPVFFRRTERLRFFLRYRGHARLTTPDKDLVRLVLRQAGKMRAEQLHRVEAAQPQRELTKS